MKEINKTPSKLKLEFLYRTKENMKKNKVLNLLKIDVMKLKLFCNEEVSFVELINKLSRLEKTLIIPNSNIKAN